MPRRRPCFPGLKPGLLLALCAGAVGVCSLLGLEETAPATDPVEVVVDGKVIAPAANGYVIPASHKSVSFRLGTPADRTPQGGRRMRFRLDGVDAGWRETPSEMSVMIQFGNASGDQVGQQTFRVTGSSESWKSSIESSGFTPRSETVRVPADSRFVTVAISSSGPPTATGVYAVRDLKILRSGTSEPLLTALPGGERLDGSPEGWIRSGTRPSMAKMISTGEGDAFCVLDNDPNAHAEWHSLRSIAPAVQPGEVLMVQWAEMYDIGMSNRLDVGYGRLGAGKFSFWTQELEADGMPVGTENHITLVVLEPFWKSAWFLLGCTGAAGVLGWLGFRVIVRRKIRQHLARAEREHLVVQERLRIARDLHDDLGVRLTHISLVSGLAENDPQSAGARASLQQISGMTRELVAALYQTVWTVNPENDHLEALVNFLCQLTHNVCETAGIRCRIHSCDVPRERRVTSELRHNITLAVKEVLHNAIKHADTAEITVRMEFKEPALRITIEDHGRGFDAATVTAGHGLENMRRRMGLIGGTVSVESSAGTRVRFEVPIAAQCP